MNEVIASRIRRLQELTRITLPDRKIVVGTSASALAWTDGATYIALERRLLRRGIASFEGLSEMASVLVHEYLHMSDDTGSHQHDSDFMQRFHDISVTGLIGSAVHVAMKRVVRGATTHRASPYKVPAALLRQIDLITRLNDPSLASKLDAVAPDPDDATESASSERLPATA